MTEHSHYDELLALAAGGHLSPQESEDVRRHLAVCAECRENARAYRDVVSIGLPLTFGETRGADAASGPADGALRERFLARATREGAHFSPDVETRSSGVSWSFALRLAAGIAFLAVAIGSGFYLSDIPHRLATATDAERELERVKDENTRLSSTLAARDATLAGQQAEIQKLQARLDTVARTAGNARGDVDQRGFQLGQSRSFEARLLEELQNRDKQLAAAAEEISRVNQLRTRDRAELDREGNRLKEALNQLRIARATIDVERELASAGRDVLQLMAAKQLRVVDVRDTDASGRATPAFARVFITESSVRIFAFDMSDGNSGAPRRFQVWGEQLGDANSVRSLGVLNVDDRTQNRWSLTIQNADVIRNINSVFVTTASRDSAPDGPRLLYAFLGRS